MASAEHSFSYLLRNSGEVLEEVEYRDIVLQRRDGEDLYLALHSRQQGIRDSLGVLARFLRATLHDERAQSATAKWLTEEIPWTQFLPESDRRAFLDDFARTAAACVEIENYEPLTQSLRGWKATAEAYADPNVAQRLKKRHRGRAVPVHRPDTSRVRAR